MVLKLESKRCADLASTAYIEEFISQLIFPFTYNLLGELFPNPTQQRKWIKELLITWYQEMNDSCWYSAIMIEITSGEFHSGPPMSEGLYVSSPWPVLFRRQPEWLAE